MDLIQKQQFSLIMKRHFACKTHSYLVFLDLLSTDDFFPFFSDEKKMGINYRPHALCIQVSNSDISWVFRNGVQKKNRVISQLCTHPDTQLTQFWCIRASAEKKVSFLLQTWLLYLTYFSAEQIARMPLPAQMMSALSGLPLSLTCNIT